VKILVIKFGGTSIGDTEAMLRSAALVRGQVDQWDGLVVVVSAMRGATNLLLNFGKTAANGGSQAVLKGCADDFAAIHRKAINALDLKGEERLALNEMVNTRLAELSQLGNEIRKAGQTRPEQLDALAALGELSSAPLFAALLRKFDLTARPVDARQFIHTDARFQNAVVQAATTRSRTRAALLPMVAAGRIPVVTGFIGADSLGRTTTLGRGAGDYSSTIVAGCLDAAEVWNLTDVDGVMTADPRLAPEAKTIVELSFDEMKKLATVGARVLHPDTVFPLVEAGIPLRVMNTFNPASQGTLIRPVSGGHSGRALGVVCTIEGDEARIIVVGGRPNVRKLQGAAIRQGIQVLSAKALTICAGAVLAVAAEDGERAARIIHNQVFGVDLASRNVLWFSFHVLEKICGGLQLWIQRESGRRLGDRIKASKM